MWSSAPRCFPASAVFPAYLGVIGLRTGKKASGVIAVTAGRVQGDHRVVGHPSMELRIGGLIPLGPVIGRVRCEDISQSQAEAAHPGGQ